MLVSDRHGPAGTLGRPARHDKPAAVRGGRMTSEVTDNGDRNGAPEPAPTAAATAPVLVLEHVVKSFGAVHALSDGSIELYPGEAHALVGENGAGKSTLVKILAGVHRPDSGLLTLAAKRSRSVARRRLAPRGSLLFTRSPRFSPISRWRRTFSSAVNRCAPGAGSTGRQ